jgi:ABC-type antimicrobial peptide transport system permease subunit
MGMHFHGQPQSLEAEVRRALGRVDPNLTVVDLRSLEYQVAGNFSQEHLIALLTSLFGVLSLVLASVGLYGITSYQVNQRTKEIGLRMALGASRRGVLLLVLRGALMQVGLGLGVGIPVALLGGGLMADQLYVVKSYAGG